MARATRTIHEGLPAHAVVWLFLGALIFELAFYKRSEKTWRDGTTYEVRAESIALGAPLPWLGHTAVTSNGAPPPIELLPEGTDYLPGVHVDPPRAGVAATTAFGVSLVLFALGWFVWPRMRRRGEVPSALGSLAVAACGAVVGALSPTDPLWIGMLLGLVLLPLAIAIACWRARGVVPIVITSGIGVLCFLWTERVVALVRARADSNEFDMQQDLIAPGAMFAIYVLVAWAIVAAKRVASS
jgi:hypothetical protein